MLQKIETYKNSAVYEENNRILHNVKNHCSFHLKLNLEVVLNESPDTPYFSDFLGNIATNIQNSHELLTQFEANIPDDCREFFAPVLNDLLTILKEESERLYAFQARSATGGMDDPDWLAWYNSGELTPLLQHIPAGKLAERSRELYRRHSELSYES